MNLREWDGRPILAWRWRWPPWKSGRAWGRWRYVTDRHGQNIAIWWVWI